MPQADYLTMQVLIRSSKIGKDVGNITLIDTTIPLPVYKMIAPEQLSVLERTILRLFNTIMENKTAFQTTSTGAGKFDAIANQGIQFRDAILKGMPPVIRQALAAGKPQLEDLFDNISSKSGPHKLSNIDPRTAIYALVFRKSEQNQGFDDAKEMGKCCGKSIKVGHRRSQHSVELAKAKPQGHLYTQAHGDEWTMLILSDLSNVPSNIRDIVMQVAEQIFVCLLNTTTPLLLSADALARQESLSKYAINCLAATQFQAVQKRVFDETGCEATSFLGQAWRICHSNRGDLHGRPQHPYSWANCTEPGAWSNSELLNKIAIRISRKDADGEKTEWLQFKGFYWDTIPESKHVTFLHVKVQRIYDALMQVEYDETPKNKLPEWMKKGPRISVKVLQYDHLKQELRLVEQTPLRLPVPHLRSFEENTVNLYNMYGPDLMFGDDGRPEKGLHIDIQQNQPSTAPCAYLSTLNINPLHLTCRDTNAKESRRLILRSRSDMGATVEELEDENGQDDVDMDDGLG
ncbi:uncharacterized protein PAC_08819 [Phialocephala subalpina]|uniref:Uncharacterized protein n=1 Tax=Phialocephala subalpina TaxID=576137 RepID=A0A1L7X1M4_9HELO|nr:uncharacterized protein PAC_08819 [Phialocephala subalpina]